MHLYKKLWATLFLFWMSLGAALACSGNSAQMVIHKPLKYVCPSATPRPTNTMSPEAPPAYPAAFAANLNYHYVEPSRSTVNVQYLAQNVGWVRLSYSGLFDTGMVWSGGMITLVYTSANTPGVISWYPLIIPANVVSATISIYANGVAQSFPMVRYSTVYPGVATPMPCCLPAPIYPTPRPTYTPYPTPTLYQKTDDFFLDDPVYNYGRPIRVRIRLKSPVQEGSFVLWPIFTAASWTFEITNVGSTPYDYLGGLYTYISEVNDDGVIKTGVWSPAHEAAIFLGVQEEAYGPVGLLPGQTITIRVAAFIPATSHVTKVSFSLNPYKYGDPGWQTYIPGEARELGLATWINQPNTLCQGEILVPS